MLTGPIQASTIALSKAGLSKDAIDVWEINEAFAVQAAYVLRELAIDEKRVNVNGGAIAIGHPIGASGARTAVTLLHEMQRSKAKTGIASLCIGGGMGISLALEGV